MQVYDISENKQTNLEKAIYDKTKRDEARSRIELLQDFEFPNASRKMHFTEDGRSLIVGGVYPPQFKVFSLSELSAKYTRYVTSEIIGLAPVSEDWAHLALLLNNNTVEFHNQGSIVDEVRLPFTGRGCLYSAEHCELFCVGTSSDLLSFNLEHGHFSRKFPTKQPSLSSCAQSQQSRLVAAGGIHGVVSFFDGRLSEAETQPLHFERGICTSEITSLKFIADGITVCAGTAEGFVFVYDIRSHKPLLVKDHLYDSGICQIEESGEHILSSDNYAIRVWNKRTGETRGNIETPAEINDFCIDGGYVAVACEQEKLQSYYLPELGMIPPWASTIEQTVDALEERAEANYRFVTEKELAEEPGEEHHPCMHGYIVNTKPKEENTKSVLKQQKKETQLTGRKTKKAPSVWG